MSRIPLADVPSLNSVQRAQYERFPSNLTRTVLLLDERLGAQLPATANALRASDLDPAVREAVILRVAALHDSAYERLQHLGQAHATGWTDSDIENIETGNYQDMSDGVAAVLTFVDALVAGDDVPDPVFADARAVLSDRHVVTVIVLVGHYMTVARLTRVLRVELDDHPDNWTAEH
ncbi:carboxymuconolactone decarboxylase family protein [Rudaeicoccus suwonensis]|uniref:Alkylhydroperoxidase family enzyme n=1 Tax=Rudaeicoccus suwonensis TaxID=657409 RepID=A0A561E845_9MICO|nr:carboxymuconolactone decarboxylase family protein [Rudaeicoccus suwonensis]TWE11766.1 alkylhydroperoxidase family enzyme [Rudaeicoccus suwonensis]